MARAKRRQSPPGAVRIIGGAWRRRKIPLPEGVDLRPTPDRVRETLFNWLAPRLPGAMCLDLFAGTGALGFEALSRGASRAVLIERDPRAVAALKRLRDELAAPAGVVRAAAADWLAGQPPELFDIVFVDPPYSLPVDGLFAALPPLLAPGACIYLERPRAEAWPQLPGYVWTRRSTAGAVAFGLAERAGSDFSGNLPPGLQSAR